MLDKFDMSAFNYIEKALKLSILEVLERDFPEIYQVLNLDGAHLFLSREGEKITLRLSFYGCSKPSLSGGFKWEVKGARYNTEISPAYDVDYFGSDTYEHDDFFLNGEKVELI